MTTIRGLLHKKHSGPYQDYEPICIKGSISSWIEEGYVSDDDLDNIYSQTKIENFNNIPDIDDTRLVEIQTRKRQLYNRLAKLNCISTALADASNRIEFCDEISLKDVEIAKQDKVDNAHRNFFVIDDDDYEKYYVRNREKISIWNRIKSRTQDLYYRAGMYVGRAMFAAGSYSIDKIMSQPEMKLGENLAEYEWRVKRIGMAKVIGLVVLSIVAIHGVNDLIDNYRSNSPSPSHINIDHSQFDNALKNHSIVSDMPDFNIEAYNVDPGEGWYSTMEQMGISDPAVQHQTLQRVGPQLQDMNLAYPVDGNSWGIKVIGRLPQEALDLIWNNSQL